MSSFATTMTINAINATLEKKALKRSAKKKSKTQHAIDESIDESSQKVLRSSTTPRSRARSELDSDELPCTVCGSDRVQVRQQRIHTKYRISELDGARWCTKFLRSSKFFK